MKLNTLKFALAGGIYLAGCGALVTIMSLINFPGFPQFTKSLIDIYGAYGYSISVTGIFTGAFWGFVEGFVHIGLFGLIYNKLIAK